MWVMDIFLISIDMWGGARPPKVRGPRANGDLKKKNLDKESTVLKQLHRRYWCFKRLFLEFSEGDKAAFFILKLKGIKAVLNICRDGE